MRLSEAIRLGAMLKPQAFGTYLSAGRTCALGAAADAIGRLDRVVADGRVGPDMKAEWGWIESVETSCPVCVEFLRADATIAHLNDFHHWTRERIAEWVATVEPPASTLVDAPTEVGAVLGCPVAPASPTREKVFSS